jgi:hypothetical protein
MVMEEHIALNCRLFFCLSWRYLALFAVKKNFILKGLVYLPAEITSELDLDSDW